MEGGGVGASGLAAGHPCAQGHETRGQFPEGVEEVLRPVLRFGPVSRDERELGGVVDVLCKGPHLGRKVKCGGDGRGGRLLLGPPASVRLCHWSAPYRTGSETPIP